MFYVAFPTFFGKRAARDGQWGQITDACKAEREWPSTEADTTTGRCPDCTMKGRGNHRLPWPGITSRGQNLLVLPSTHENTRLSTTSCWQRYAGGGGFTAFKKSPPGKQIGGAEFSGFTPWSFTVRGKTALFLWKGKVVFEAWLKSHCRLRFHTFATSTFAPSFETTSPPTVPFAWKGVALKMI